MVLVTICLVGLGVLIFGLVRRKKTQERREREQYSIGPEELHALMQANQEILLFDVRQPLDLLAHSEILPGAKRLAPKELLEQTSLIPKDKDSILYCTCVSEKTSRMILHKALALNFSRIRFLRGGLEGWKAKGYPVERYDTPFHLDTAT